MPLRKKIGASTLKTGVTPSLHRKAQRSPRHGVYRSENVYRVPRSSSLAVRWPPGIVFRKARQIVAVLVDHRVHPGLSAFANATTSASWISSPERRARGSRGPSRTGPRTVDHCAFFVSSYVIDAVMHEMVPENVAPRFV